MWFDGNFDSNTFPNSTVKLQVATLEIKENILMELLCMFEPCM